jgi:hypothetical protein
MERESFVRDSLDRTEGKRKSEREGETDEFLDDSMEDDAVVVAVPRVGAEVFDGQRRTIGEEAEVLNELVKAQ